MTAVSRTRAGRCRLSSVRLAVCVASLMMTAVLALEPSPPAASDWVHWRRPDKPRGWALLLPGAGGVRIFNDDRHYDEAARRLGNAGWASLLVDYRAGRRAVHISGRTRGEQIASVSAAAVAWLRQTQPEVARLPSAIVAYSLGAEGALAMMPRPSPTWNVRGAVFYYPSIPRAMPPAIPLPVLVLSGDRDDVIPPARTEAFVHAWAAAGSSVEWQHYAGAAHGFDVESLRDGRTVRPLRWFGPSATLRYDKRAADDAEQRMLAFLTSILGPS